MAAMFGRQRAEGGLDARIAGLSDRHARLAESVASRRKPPAAMPAAPPPPAAETLPVEDGLARARDDLTARLDAEIRPERRALLSRADLANMVEATVQAYWVRHAIKAGAAARRDLVADIIQRLATPGDGDGETRRGAHRAAVEAAKAQIQPLILEHMDIAAAAEMPRAAFETQLAGWVQELLAESRIHLNYVEQRELIESLVADMLGLGPLEPLLADESITGIMVNGPKQVYVERRGKLELSDVAFRDDQHLMNVCSKIVTRVGRRIDESTPLVDARLPDGSRVNIIIPPLAIDGASISIRKFSKKSITLDTMAANGSISPAMATVLK